VLAGLFLGAILWILFALSQELGLHEELEPPGGDFGELPQELVRQQRRVAGEGVEILPAQ
jgi:hypothetical protein